MQNMGLDFIVDVDVEERMTCQHFHEIESVVNAKKIF